MPEFKARKFRAKIDEFGSDDFGASGLTFKVQSLTKDKVYTEENPEYLSTKQKGVVIDDNSCWWHYGTYSFSNRFEEIK